MAVDHLDRSDEILDPFELEAVQSYLVLSFPVIILLYLEQEECVAA